MMMAFSPAAVFADVEAQGDMGDAVEAAAEPGVTAESADVAADTAKDVVAAPEQMIEEAQDAEADLPPVEAEVQDVETYAVPVEAEAVQAEAAAEGTTADEESDIYTWVVKEDGTRDYTQAKKGDQLAKGLFKAKRYKNRAVDGTSLFYATENGVVEQKEQVVTGSGYIHEKSDEGEAWKADSGTYKYLVTLHDGFENGYFVYWQKGLKSVDGKTYFVQDNGTVRINAGVLPYEGNKYYILDGGEIQKTAGWVADVDGTRYYLPAETAAAGTLRIAEGMFPADGKTWYSAAGGAVRTTGGLFSYNGSLYYSYDDGSVNTAEGFITTGGKTYLCASGGAIRSTAGVVDFGGKKYVALADGSICMTPGFVSAGGALYYVGNTSGALVVNKEFKSGSKKYHALADGTIAAGVHKWGKYYYYGDSNGAIRTKKGIFSWAGNRYYAKKGGKVTTNKKFKYKGKTYICSSTGAFLRGIFTWKKNLYYASTKGVLRTKAGMFTYAGNRYYSRKGGKLYVNKFFTVGSKKYLAQIDGTLKAGIFTWKGKMYLTNAKCAVITKAGLYTYGNHQYYVKKGGPLALSEFVTYKDNHYYAGSDGAIVKKAFTYKGVTLNPNATTGVIPLEEYWQVFPNEAPQQDTTNSGN